MDVGRDQRNTAGSSPALRPGCLLFKQAAERPTAMQNLRGSFFARSASIRVFMLLILLVAAAFPASALNQRMYPLKELVQDADSIAVGRVVAVDAPKMRAALVIEDALKGKPPCKWIA